MRVRENKAKSDLVELLRKDSTVRQANWGQPGIVHFISNINILRLYYSGERYVSKTIDMKQNQ